jgi:hypothetical protein
VNSQYETLRATFHEVVSCNRIRPSELWGLPCSGWNIQALLTPDAVQTLGRVQASLLVSEPESLYCCPPEALHLSVAPILESAKEYAFDKETWWSEIGGDCAIQLQAVMTGIPAFSVTYTRLIATDSAVIAVGVDNGSLARIREAIRHALPIPTETAAPPDILHTTLFRYCTPLRDPVGFLESLDRFATELMAITTRIDRLYIRRELCYPSLASEVVCIAECGSDS